MLLLESVTSTIGKLLFIIIIKVPKDLGMSMLEAEKLFNAVILSQSKNKGNNIFFYGTIRSFPIMLIYTYVCN